jgi:hypothetical protein
MRWMCLLVLGCVAVAAPAQAGRRCNEPYAPIIKTDAAVSTDQLASMRSDVAAFIAASDIYQKCLIDTKDTSGRIGANQAVKERLGREFNALLKSSAAGRKSTLASNSTPS